MKGVFGGVIGGIFGCPVGSPFCEAAGLCTALGSGGGSSAPRRPQADRLSASAVASAKYRAPRPRQNFESPTKIKLHSTAGTINKNGGEARGAPG